MSLRALTPAEVQANRNAAAAAIKLRLGLPASPSSWSYEQRGQYNAELARYIAARPAEFPDLNDQRNAASVLASPQTALEDTSFDWGMFATETARPVTDLGEGVASTLSMGKWLIPVVTVAAVVIGLFALANRTGARRA